jgi:hypothetical protein
MFSRFDSRKSIGLALAAFAFLGFTVVSLAIPGAVAAHPAGQNAHSVTGVLPKVGNGQDDPMNFDLPGLNPVQSPQRATSQPFGFGRQTFLNAQSCGLNPALSYYMPGAGLSLDGQSWGYLWPGSQMQGTVSGSDLLTWYALTDPQDAWWASQFESLNPAAGWCPNFWGLSP